MDERFTFEIIVRMSRGPKSSSSLKDLSANNLKCCVACECCVKHERWIRKQVELETAEAFVGRARRGSRFKPGDAVFVKCGVLNPEDSVELRERSKGSACSMASEEAFAILAPPIPFQNSRKEILKSSAAKLYFVITHCRRNLDLRINHEAAEGKWYLTEKEFERILLTSGVDWMERTSIFETYRKVDLNQSGSIHVAELGAVLRGADEVCREILNEGMDLEAFITSILKYNGPLPLQLSLCV